MCEGLPSNNILVANSNANDLIFDSNTGITNTINNKTYYSNGSVINGSCNSGYLEAEDIKYTCVNGSWNKSGGSCTPKCNDLSPIYDINGNKISNQLYGTTFESNGNVNETHTYLVCYKNNNISVSYNLNSNGTGLISPMEPEEYIKCSYDTDSLKLYHNQLGKKLICKNNNNFFYWRYDYASCPLNELVPGKLPNVEVKLNYITTSKTVENIINSGAKQERFPVHYDGSGYRADWNVLYSSFNPNNNGDIKIQCNSNGTWKISVKVDFVSESDSSRSSYNYFDLRTEVSCNNHIFEDPHLGKKKACKINGEKVSYEDTRFIVLTKYNQIKVDFVSTESRSKNNYKYFNKGSKITCNNETFGDPDPGEKKVCQINGAQVAKESESFIVP